MAFTGAQAPLALGDDGFNANHSVSTLTPGELLQALNITYENGTIQREGGSSLYTTVPLGSIILGGRDWWPTPIVQRGIVVTSDGRILKDSGSGSYGVTLASGLATPTTPVFVEGGKEAAANNKKLFMFTGTNQCQVLSGDGVATAPIASPPADWAAQFPIGGCLHLSRLWAFGGANPHMVYYSDLASHENMTGGTSGQLAVYPGQGERIISIISFKRRLLIFKYPRGIYVADTTDPVITNWYVYDLSLELGLAGPLTWAPVDDDIMFMDAIGALHMLSAVREFGDYGLRSVSDSAYMLTWIRDTINQSRLGAAQALFYPNKREAHFCLSTIGSANNNIRMVVDFNRGDRIRFRYSDKDAIESIWLTRDANQIPRPTGGDVAGRVWSMDQAVKAVNGAGYPSVFQTPHLDLAEVDATLAGRRKNGKFLQLIAESKGNWTVQADVFWDGRYVHTILFNMGTTGQVLGSFMLDRDSLASASIATVRRRLYGSGMRLSVVFSLANPNQDFSIDRGIVYFTPGDERDPR